MDAQARQEKTGTARTLAAVLLAALSVLVVAAVAAPPAEAHQTPGRTTVSVDGNVVKNTRNNHFTVERVFSPGCHSVEVVQRRGGDVVSDSRQRECSKSRTILEVGVDDSNVQVRTSSKSISQDSEMAR